jgi:hypothetical protein
MAGFIEIKKSDALVKQVIEIICPDGIVNVDWDFTHNAINLHFNGRLFWLYTPDNVIVDDQVVSNITLRQLIAILGYGKNDITITSADSNIWDKLVYKLPLCQVIVHQDQMAPYLPFKTGFTPFLDSIESF